jgi:sugar phosphate isomerase/epimerase
MNISVFNPILYHMGLEQALMYLKAQGVYYVELGCGGFPGTTHADAKVLAGDSDKLNDLKNTLKKHAVGISALSVHGNPVHPDKAVARAFHEDFVGACKIAKSLGVDTIVTFSGCAGGCESDKTPNWVTCAWPPDFLEILDYQWNKVLIPYWKQAADIAKQNGVKHIALEMHPGFNVYNGETLLKLRAAVGDIIGANFDPSHLIWQGIDPVTSLKDLLSHNAVYNFHAKDTALDPHNTAKNGVLDTKHYTDEVNRSWIFRTIGYGSGEKAWKDMISVLSMYGYDKCVTIEHEDSLMTPEEGLNKAISFLKSVIIKDKKPTSIGWA